MMHRFCDWGERDENCLPTDTLDNCLRYLINNDYSVIPLSAYINKLITQSTIHKTIVLTVDDGYHDFYEHAYPVLRKYNTPAAVFLITDFINAHIIPWWDQIKYCIENTQMHKIEITLSDEKKYFSLKSAAEKKEAATQTIEDCKNIPDDQKTELIRELAHALDVNMNYLSFNKKQSLSWDEIIEMKNHNIEFFPHTKTHPILTNISAEKVEHEISESKKQIEAKLNTLAKIFCYPNGRFQDFNDGTITLLKKSGYVAALTSQEGFNHAQKKIDLFRLKRYSFPNDFMRFKQLVSGLEAFKGCFRANNK